MSLPTITEHRRLHLHVLGGAIFQIRRVALELQQVDRPWWKSNVR